MLRCTVVSQLMSQLGQKRTLSGIRAMSALPPKADMAESIGMSLCAISGHQQHYSITWSAIASRLGGTARPSALAVLRLITSSNLVG